ncbi:restriction endonuclease subunit S [Corynebacterium sanguinis]|uniref:restriction endonuclease subunit S n=1 Tax=Corynebacterium sanguinis TaxID=2594913 RepID=UPI0021AE9A21|nr:restriction endonuclease subunit S [Corynebacterium sanguinis]MCT1664639.1 restriction endonuclease subunit S [Corynebacterium sanguinis]
MIKSQKIGDVLTVFDNARRPIKSNERIPGTTPYLGASGVVDYVEGKTHDGPLLCLAEDGENLQSRSLPVAWCQDGEFWANNHVHVLGGVSRDRLKFFEYAILNTDLSGFITGSAQPKLSRQAMKDIVVPNFGVAMEERIGEFFGALDDKIAANQRVMAISYRLIQTIGATVQEFVELGSVAQTDKKSVTPEMMSGKTVQLHSIPGFDTGEPELVDGETIKSGKFLLVEPRVLVSKLNPLTPRVWNTSVADEGELVVCSTEFIPLSSSEVPNSALYASLIQPEFSSRLSECASGTSNSHQRVKPEDMFVTPIRDPREFTDIQIGQLEALSSMVNDLMKQNQSLARTRDELLPLLMSGKITVAEAEQEVEEMGVEKRAEGAGNV